MTPDEQTPHSNQKYHQDLEEQCYYLGQSLLSKTRETFKAQNSFANLRFAYTFQSFHNCQNMKSYDRWMNNKVLFLKSYL